MKFKLPGTFKWPTWCGMVPPPPPLVPDAEPPMILVGNCFQVDFPFSHQDLSVIYAAMPFMEISDADERHQAIKTFMDDALQFHLVGAEHMLKQPLDVIDEDGQRLQVYWENGDSDDAESSGWCAAPWPALKRVNDSLYCGHCGTFVGDVCNPFRSPCKCSGAVDARAFAERNLG